MARCKHRGRQLILLKPSTFMNLSGKAVRHWLDAEKLDLDRLLVVTDDIHLPYGTLRLRGKGSDGGHNGLKDIQAVLGTSNYARLRFGVGADFGPVDKWTMCWFVLRRGGATWMAERLGKVTDLMRSFAFVGLQRTDERVQQHVTHTLKEGVEARLSRSPHRISAAASGIR